ncbi:MAG: aldo/keto reductase [Gemmatimonadales bacterium]|jgi:aryl-alcohol dehydrogenase-like predicted oxidoreductase
MILTRRDMIKLSASAGAALTLGRLPAFAQDITAIRKRPIPSTGELIPVVGLGTARTFNVGTSEEERAPLREVLKAFVDMGGTLLDTAEGYGNSEAVSGDLAQDLGVNDTLFMATKVGAEGEEAGIAEMEKSMRLLHRDTIDLMQVHNLRDWQTQLATLRDWKAAGKLRYIGITTSRSSQYDEFAAVMEKEDLDFIQVNYSLAQRQAAERILPLAADRGMAVLVNLPYGRGRLFQAVGGRELPEWAAEFDAETWGQFFLKWIIGHPAVTCPIPATTKAHHARDNMGAAYGRLPDDAMRRRMVEFFDEL